MQNNNPLNLIREGMKVYDVDGDHVGTVEEVYFGQGGTEVEVEDDDNLFDVIEDIFAGESNMPRELKERLIRRGYVRIDGPGLLTSDRYVMPEQIALVSEDSVKLRADDDDVLKDNRF